MRYFNRVIENKLNSNQYNFAIQTQSMFDSSSKMIPNFVYTDHTMLNNFNYPLINPIEYRFSSQYWLNLILRCYRKKNIFE